MRAILALATAALACCSPGVSFARDAEPEPDLRVLLTGDVSFGENYQLGEPKKGRPDILATYGYDYSLEKLAPMLRRADYTIVNLETPLTDLPVSPLADAGKDYYHWSHIDKAPAKLAAYGVDAVGLANNHTVDFGIPGLLQTFVTLRRYGITSFGAGENAAAASAPLVRVFKVGDHEVPIALIAGFERRKSYEKFGFYAGADTPGVNALTVGDVAGQVKELRRRNPGVFIIYFAHWGKNYAWRAPEQQVDARAMIDAGVDMVVGHHGHMMQEIERYKDKWILYGLGNFMFNSAGRFAAYPDAIPFGVALELGFREKDGKLETAARLYPVASDNLKVDFQPRPVRGADADLPYTTLLRRSALGKDEALVSRGEDEIGAYFELRGISPPGR